MHEQHQPPQAADLTQGIDMNGPVRLVIREFRGACAQVQAGMGDGELKAAQILGAADMAIRWIGTYRDLVIPHADCVAAGSLIAAESRKLITQLTNHGCEYSQLSHKEISTRVAH